MTTKAELKKYARAWLTPEIRQRGFELTPKGYAYNARVGGVWHFLIPELNADGGKMNMTVTAWVPEFALQPYDLENLPNEVSILSGGRLGESGLGNSYTLFPAATAEQCSSSFPKLMELIDRVAIPWLQRIDSREKLANVINPASATDRFGNRAVDKIFGRNLLFRDQVKPISADDFRKK